MADRIEDGGPAFPVYTPDMNIGDDAGPGMSMRDWFAGQALAQIAGEYHESGIAHWPQHAAAAAYEVADAMLAVRQKGGA